MGRRRYVKTACVYCSKSFEVRADDFRLVRGNCCSRSCGLKRFNRDNPDHQRGENNAGWLGGVSKDNMRYRRRQREKWPEKESARRKVRHALKTGRLTRLPCERCGAVKTQGHHDDYSRPLDVRWLCRSCHDAHHLAEKAGRTVVEPTILFFSETGLSG